MSEVVCSNRDGTWIPKLIDHIYESKVKLNETFIDKRSLALRVERHYTYHCTFRTTCLLRLQIKYQNKDNSCFLNQENALDGQVGEGPAVVDEIEGIQIPALYVLVNLGYSGFSRASSYDFTIVSFTGIGGHEYEFLSPSLSENSSPDCTGIPIKESIKIVESLQYLDPKDTKVFQIKDDDVILIDD